MFGNRNLKPTGPDQALQQTNYIVTDLAQSSKLRANEVRCWAYTFGKIMKKLDLFAIKWARQVMQHEHGYGYTLILVPLLFSVIKFVDYFRDSQNTSIGVPFLLLVISGIALQRRGMALLLNEQLGVTNSGSGNFWRLSSWKKIAYIMAIVLVVHICVFCYIFFLRKWISLEPETQSLLSRTRRYSE